MNCLRKLWSLLQEVSDLSIDTSDLYLDYETLVQLRAQLKRDAAAGSIGEGDDVGSENKLTASECAKVLQVLTPSRILRLQKDRLGRVSTRALFTFAHLFSRTRKAEVDLRRLCDAPGQEEKETDEDASIISIPNLQRFILERASSMPVLSPLSVSMRAFAKQYARVAAQRFCFYERRADRRMLNIGSVLGSPVLSEFLDLQQVNSETDPSSKALAMHYWFSIPNIKKIYNCFLVREFAR